MYVFISHSSADYKVAEGLCEQLEGNGHKCFLAPRDIRSGYEYAEEIMNGIEKSDAMVLLLSNTANQSPHVLREIERAVSKKIRILVYKLEDVELTKSMEYFLMSHQWVAAKKEADYREILKGLETYAEADDKKDEADKQVTKSKGGIGPVVLAACVVLLIAFGTIWLMRPKEEQKSQGNSATMDFAAQVKLGDSIVLGSYNGEAIEWRVLQISEDGRTAIVVSKDILTMKAFDAAEGGRYNYYEGADYWGRDITGESEEVQRLLRGDNRWSVSNIRIWLNAAAENVTYMDQKPERAAMSELKNGYDAEAGFLSTFTEAELAAIVETEVETNGEITKDKVFLLSSEELDWFREADVSLAAVPTQAAVEQDRSDWYDVLLSTYEVKDYSWWLRDAAENAYEANMVTNSVIKEVYEAESVGLEGFGIRPAMKIDLTAECFVCE